MSSVFICVSEPVGLGNDTRNSGLRVLKSPLENIMVSWKIVWNVFKNAFKKTNFQEKREINFIDFLFQDNLFGTDFWYYPKTQYSGKELITSDLSKLCLRMCFLLCDKMKYPVISPTNILLKLNVCLSSLWIIFGVLSSPDI